MLSLIQIDFTLLSPSLSSFWKKKKQDALARPQGRAQPVESGLPPPTAYKALRSSAVITSNAIKTPLLLNTNSNLQQRCRRAGRNIQQNLHK